MKLTWIGPYKPIPDRSGADLRSYFLMREVARRGASIRGYFLGSHGSECDQFLAESTVLPRKSIRASLRAGWRRLLRGEPLTAGRFYHPQIKRAVSDGGLVYVDHLHLAPNVLSHSDIPYWLDEHNLESELWTQYASVCHPLKRWFVEREVDVLKTYEQRAIRQSAGTGLPSIERDMNLSEDVRNRLTAIPNGVPEGWLDEGEQRLEESLSTTPIFGFIGKYDWFPNRIGVNRFLRTAWKPFHQNYPQSRLILAGQSSPAEWSNYDGVDVRGFVDSKRDFFRTIDAMVIPLNLGSGTRLKALEAAARGLPLLSTEKGTEGLDLGSLPLASSIPDLEQLMGKMVEHPAFWEECRTRSYQAVSDQYRWTTIGETLWSRLEPLT